MYLVPNMFQEGLLVPNTQKWKKSNHFLSEIAFQRGPGRKPRISEEKHKIIWDNENVKETVNEVIWRTEVVGCAWRLLI